MLLVVGNSICIGVLTLCSEYPQCWSQHRAVAVSIFVAWAIICAIGITKGHAVHGVATAVV